MSPQREIRNQNGQILKANQGQVSALRKELVRLSLEERLPRSTTSLGGIGTDHTLACSLVSLSLSHAHQLELKNSSKAQIHSQYAQHIRTKGALSNTDKQRVIILAESYGWSGTKKSKNMTSHDIGVNWISALEALETSSLPNLSHDNGLLRSSNDNARG